MCTRAATNGNVFNYWFDQKMPEKSQICWDVAESLQKASKTNLSGWGLFSCHLSEPFPSADEDHGMWWKSEQVFLKKYHDNFSTKEVWNTVWNTVEAKQKASKWTLSGRSLFLIMVVLSTNTELLKTALPLLDNTELTGLLILWRLCFSKQTWMQSLCVCYSLWTLPLVVGLSGHDSGTEVIWSAGWDVKTNGDGVEHKTTQNNAHTWWGDHRRCSLWIHRFTNWSGRGRFSQIPPSTSHWCHLPLTVTAVHF